MYSSFVRSNTTPKRCNLNDIQCNMCLVWCSCSSLPPERYLCLMEDLRHNPSHDRAFCSNVHFPFNMLQYREDVKKRTWSGEDFVSISSKVYLHSVGLVLSWRKFQVSPSYFLVQSVIIIIIIKTCNNVASIGKFPFSRLNLREYILKNIL